MVIKQKRKKTPIFVALFFIFATALFYFPKEAGAARPIVFPVIGPATFSNDYLAPRANGNHHAIDIFAPKGRKLVAAVNGTITHVSYPQPSWGYSITITDADGYRYRYIHINNDNPGSDDGRGGGMNAYAADVEAGNKVIRGQHIGYLGDSGNAENTVPHLHFEMFNPDGDVANPYTSLRAAKRIGKPITPVNQDDELLPYNQFKGGARISAANFDSDPELELTIGPGPGGGPRLIILDDDMATELNTFYALDTSFRGGVNVAAGDVDNDGVDEIIVGAGPGGSPLMRVFEMDGTLLLEETVYGPGFKGGVNVAVGDIDNDTVPEIITGAGPGGGPRVRAFELDGTPLLSMYAYTSGFRGGVDVATGDVQGDTTDEIITGTGPGGIPFVKVFDIDRNVYASFPAYASNFRGGLKVSAGEIDEFSPFAEIVTIPSEKGEPLLKIFSPTEELLDDYHVLEEWWEGYYDVTAGDEFIKVATGKNRRTSIRDGQDTNLWW